MPTTGQMFLDVDGDTNVLLDVDGPGCIHRISTGLLEGGDFHGQILDATFELWLDGERTLALPATQLFDPDAGPFASPLVHDGAYPTVRMPIPSPSMRRFSWSRRRRIGVCSGRSQPSWSYEQRETVGLTLLAHILVECGGNHSQRALILAGHANSAGANAFNDELADARARCVWSLLTGD